MARQRLGLTEWDPSHRDRLKVYIDTSHPVPAAETGRLLAGLDRAIGRFAREEYGQTGFHFEIVETGTDSWWAILQAAHVTYDVSKDFPELVPFFMHHLDVVIKTLIEHGPGDTPRYLRELARSIARAGKRAAADTVQLASISRIVIGSNDFEMLDLPEPRASRTSPGDEGHPALPVLPPARMLADRSSMGRAGELAIRALLHGTIFKVAGMWYARPEGMHGVLVPLKLDTLTRLTAVNGRAYRIEGSVERSAEGYPIGIDVKQLHGLPKDPETIMMRR